MALTIKQEKFCQHYVAHRNAPAAYRYSHDVKPETPDAKVSSMASNELKHVKIAGRITELLREVTAAAAVTVPGEGEKPNELFTAVEALRMWLEMATANPDELIGLRIGCCRHCYGDGFRYQWREREYEAALKEWEALYRKGGDLPMPDIAGGFGFRKGRTPNPQCPECEGEGVERVVPRDTSKLSKGAQSLYGGVKKKRDGLEIIIADRQKALENASRIIGAFKDNVRLDGSINAMVQAVVTKYTDPNQASRAYQDFIRGHVAANP